MVDDSEYSYESYNLVYLILLKVRQDNHQCIVAVIISKETKTLLNE